MAIWLVETPETTTLFGPAIAPEANPFFNPNFFDLNFDSGKPDAVELTPGLLKGYAGGLRALDGEDFVKGSADSEIMNGNGGSDYLIGGDGDDTLRGGKDFDLIEGGDGNDIINGNQGDDYVYGGNGEDLLRGGRGNDHLVGNAGNDTLIGDFGVDKLWGGEGADMFVLRRDTAAPPQEVGSPQPRSDNLMGAVDEIPADIILDYNAAQGDVIALTGELTVNDIVLTQRFLTIGDRRDYDSTGPFPLGQMRTADFQLENITATVITEAATGNILGLVKNTSGTELQFISVPDPVLALG